MAQVGSTYNFGGTSSSSPDSCPCDILEVEIANDQTYNLDLSNPDLAKVFITTLGAATINLPAIASAAYRGVDITITIAGAGNIMITPDAADRIGTAATGATINSIVGVGQNGWLRIGSDNIWALTALLSSGASATTGYIITAADFTGNNITGQGLQALLTGLTPDVDFFIYSDDGSGALQKVNDGYTFNAGTGTITIATGAGNFRIEIF